MVNSFNLTSVFITLFIECFFCLNSLQSGMKCFYGKKSFHQSEIQVLWMWDLCYVDRAYFRKAGHACGVDKKEHFSKFRAIRTRKPLKQEANLKFWEWKNFQKSLKGHCVVFRTQKVSRISPGRRICFHINILIFRYNCLIRCDLT